MAHGAAGYHCKDIVDVLGFDENQTNVWNWAKFISSDMIDKTKTQFNIQLKKDYPFLGFSSGNTHRLLFHWCYNAEPWSSDLENQIRKKCCENNKDEESVIKDIKARVKTEQKNRNRKINEETEKLFGFAHGGIDAKYAQFFASMAYNIHLLGDQQTDNTIFLGVASTSTIIEQIILSLRMLDKSSSKPIEKHLTILNQKYSDQHIKADAVMLYLKQAVPTFIKTAQEGSIYRRLEKQGFTIN